MGLGVGRLKTSIWPWIREFEIKFLLGLVRDEAEDDKCDLVLEFVLLVTFFS